MMPIEKAWMKHFWEPSQDSDFCDIIFSLEEEEEEEEYS
jgi:hypothetical protein